MQDFIKLIINVFLNNSWLIYLGFLVLFIWLLYGLLLLANYLGVIH